MRVLVMTFLIAVCSLAFAATTVQCDVQTRGRYGYDTAIRRDVQFATGSELGPRYRSFKVYALLWFSQTQVAVLEHSGVAIGVYGNFGATDLNSLFGVLGRADFVQVNGQSDTGYRITCKQFGRWIDNRL